MKLISISFALVEGDTNTQHFCKLLLEPTLTQEDFNRKVSVWLKSCGFPTQDELLTFLFIKYLSKVERENQK